MTADAKLFALFTEIGIIAQLAGNLFERVMPEAMTLAQFTVLNHFVRLGGEKSPAQLADAFQITRGTMTSTLQRLESKKLIAMNPDPDDARGKRVSITDTGREMRERCIAAITPELERLTAQFETTDLEALLPGLRAIRIELDRSRN
jgi:DNA-binding MarR family transcriptional regulator